MSKPLNKNKTKQMLINQNISNSRIGVYSKCFTGQCIKTKFNPNFNIGEPNNICSVEVINMHAVDVMQQFCQYGFNAGFKDGWISPVTMCTVADDFTAENFRQSEGMRDDVFNIRTNYNCITRNNNPFPIKDNECVYNRFITVIRDNQLNPITDLKQIYRFAIITVSVLNKPELLDKNKMNSTDFIKTLCTIETIFQTALVGSHNVLVLTPFGQSEDDVPQEDIVKIYNSCIFKYGHHFNKIIVAIPPWCGLYMFDLFNEEIVRPQNIIDDDDK